jgi:hypothetical protein
MDSLEPELDAVNTFRMTQSFRTSRKTTDKEANEMASNDIEVLDPAATVEKVKKLTSEFALNRRQFMGALGVAGVAAGTGLVSTPVAHAQEPTPNGYTQLDVLNYLLNIKYVIATFYSYLTQNADLPGSTYVTLGTGQVYNTPTKITTFTAQQTDMLNEMYYDELNQLIDLRNLITGSLTLATSPVITRPTMSLGGAASTSATQTFTVAQAIALARMLEDTCVTAFAGALTYLSGANLAIATQCMAISGQHAAALRLVSIQTGAAYQRTQLTTTTQIGVATGSPTVITIGTLSTNIFVGANILGTGIPVGAVITAYTSRSAATFSAITTNGSNILTSVSSVALAAVGQPITGTGIPANTAITAVGVTTVTLSNNATATITTAETVTIGQSSISISLPAVATTGQPIAVSSTGYFLLSDPFDVAPADPATIPATITANSANVIVQSLIGLASGQVVTGTGIAAGTTIAAPLNTTSATAPPYTITFSVAPTAAGTSFFVPALAAAGPGASPSLVPTANPPQPSVNQGFFNTAGANSSNGANPPGFAFARTFSQVLAVLYANTTPATKTGGFFSVGVNGKINAV